MTKTTFIQKIGLFFFALCATLLLLEAGLRLGGWAFLSLQENINRQKTTSGEEYRVLCLGESTTALGGENAYPRQLETMLNSRQTKIKFKVINKGVPATTTDQILAKVPEYLRDYQPHMVIAMIGINDPQDLSRRNWRETLSLYSKAFKLFDMIAEHWAAKQKEKPSDYVDRQINKIGRQVKADPASQAAFEITKANLYRSANRPEQEKKAILKALDIDGRNAQAWLLLGIYEERHAEYPKALDALQKTFLYGSGAIKVTALERMAQTYKFLNDIPKAERIYRDILAQWPRHPEANGALGDILLEQKDTEGAIKSYQQQLSIDPQKVEVYGKLAHCYRLTGQSDKAEETFRAGAKLITKDPELYYEWGYALLEEKKYAEAEAAFEKSLRVNDKNQRGVNEKIFEGMIQCFEAQKKAELAQQAKDTLRREAGQYNLLTQKNYFHLAQILQSQKIPLIAVQYARRPVAPLKNMLSSVSGIIFVDNQQIFEAALKEYKYDDLFSDRFAGDFGHCTPKGNAILAGHVADEILKILSP